MAADLKKDLRTNRGSFGDALDELLEVLKKLDAASNESDKSTSTPSRSLAPAPRVLGQLSSKKLFEDEMVNEKAFKEKIFKEDEEALEIHSK